MPTDPAGTDAAARMDAIYRFQRHIYDATRVLFLPHRSRLVDELRPPSHGRILEIGCGTARNLIRAAARYPDCRLFGLDVSAAMLATARRSLERASLSSRIILVHADATCIDPRALLGVDGFDRVIFSYALSMIPDWRRALHLAYAALAPKGELHIADFGGLSGWPGWTRTRLTAWLARFSVVPLHDLEQELRQLALAEHAKLRFTRHLGDYACSAALERGARQAGT